MTSGQEKSKKNSGTSLMISGLSKVSIYSGSFVVASVNPSRNL